MCAPGPALMAIKIKVTKGSLDARHCILAIRQVVIAAYFTDVETEVSDWLETCPRSHNQHT